MNTTQKKVADTILQKPFTTRVGNKTYLVAPPTIGTLIMASEKIAEMPEAIEVVKGDERKCILSAARNFQVLPEILAILILGAKCINAEIEASNRRGSVRNRRKRANKYEALVAELRDNVSPSELKEVIVPLLENLQLEDFFVVTTFLSGINVTKRTKVETLTGATASGR